MTLIIGGVLGAVCLIAIIFTYLTVKAMAWKQDENKNHLEAWMLTNQKTQALISKGYLFTADDSKPVIVDPKKTMKFENIDQAWHHYITNNKVK